MGPGSCSSRRYRVGSVTRRTTPAWTQSSSRLSPGSKILDGFGSQRLAADAPFAARDFRNLDPGHSPHVFAFDRHHRVGQFLNDLALLLGIEHVLNEMNFYQWHYRSP